MSEALVSQLARALNLPPDAARHTLDHLVATLREQLEASGHAVVPGLGTFARGESGLAFEPDDALARAVNHRYAGLQPITAGAPDREPEPDDEPEPEPQPADPFADAALTTAAVGFQPLDSIVETETHEEPETAAEPEGPELTEEPTPEPVDAFEEVEASAQLPADDLLDEVEIEDEPASEAEPLEDEFDEELPETEPFETEDAPDEEAETLESFALDAEENEEPSADSWDAVEPDEEEVALDEAALDDETVADDADAFAQSTDDEFEPDADEDEVEVEVVDVEPEPIAVFGGDEDILDTDPEVTLDTEPESASALGETDHDEDDEFVATDAPEFDAAESEDADLATLLTAEPEPADATEDAAQEEDRYDDGMLGSLNDLAQPDEEASESDEDLDEEEISAILPVMSGEGSSPSSDIPARENTPEEAVAPAVAATSRATAPSKPATRRRSPAVPILIGVVAVLGIAALLWFLNREPDAPIAEQHTPADTTTIAATPPPDTQASADTATATTDTPSEPAETVATADPLRSGDGIDQAAGGFSWVIGSELSREPAEQRVAEYRAQGLRAGVIAEEAAGRTRYRVALGQFESIEQAERFRSDLPAGVPADTWLLRL